MPVEAKIMVMGCPGVGKSSLIAQLVTGDPDTNCSAQTQTTFTLGTKQISLKLLDIAGKDLLSVKAKTYGRTVQGVVFVYDVTQEKTLKQLSQAIGMVRSANAKVPMALVGNKNDLRRRVRQSDAEQMASLHGIPLFDVSATDIMAVKGAFKGLLEEIYPDGNVEAAQAKPAARHRGGYDEAPDGDEDEDGDDDVGRVRVLGPLNWKTRLLSCFGWC